MKPILLAGLLLAAPPAAAAPSPADEADTETLRTATSLLNQGKPDEVIRLVDPVLTRLEADAAGRGRRIYSGQTSTQTLAYMLTAATDKVDAVDVGPSLGRANFLKAYALIDLKQGMEAKPFLERAVALSPMNAQYLCELASWHAVRKQADTALELYGRCEDGAGTSPDEVRDRFRAAALRGKGFVLIDLGRLDEAEKAERESLKLEPGNPTALHELDFIARQRAAPGRDKI